MKGFKNVVNVCLIDFLELGEMNIIRIGSNVFALPQFSMLKSTIQQFFKLVFIEENITQ
jgi:hypothetical protein